MIRSRMTRFALMALAGAVVAGTTHLVVKGDTLWDITGHYLGNPYQWPMVWKQNPQIKNAHWIYPGDSVRIDGGGPIATGTGDTANPGLAAHPAVNDPLASFQQSPAAFRQVLDTNLGTTDLINSSETSMLDEEMVALAPILSPTSQTKRSGFEGKIQVGSESGPLQILPGATVNTDLASTETKVGDRILVVERDDQVSTVRVPELPGRLEQIRGIGLVLEVHAKNSLVRMEKVFGRITKSAILRPLELPRTAQVSRFTVVQEPKPDRVLANTRSGKVQLPGTYVIVDRGEANGVALGDIYEFMDVTQDRGIAAMRGYGMVVRTTANSATVILVGTTPEPVLPGDRGWRIRRASHG